MVATRGVRMTRQRTTTTTLKTTVIDRHAIFRLTRAWLCLALIAMGNVGSDGRRGVGRWGVATAEGWDRHLEAETAPDRRKEDLETMLRLLTTESSGVEREDLNFSVNSSNAAANPPNASNHFVSSPVYSFASSSKSPWPSSSSSSAAASAAASSSLPSQAPPFSSMRPTESVVETEERRIDRSANPPSPAIRKSEGSPDDRLSGRSIYRTKSLQSSIKAFPSGSDQSDALGPAAPTNNRRRGEPAASALSRPGRSRPNQEVSFAGMDRRSFAANDGRSSAESADKSRDRSFELEASDKYSSTRPLPPRLIQEPFHHSDSPHALERSFSPLADQPRHHRRPRHHKNAGLKPFKLTCEPTATDLLRKLMGGAFNARYMSVERPEVAEEPVETQAQLAKTHDRLLLADQPIADEKVERLPFHVGEGYSRVLQDEPTYRLVSQRRLRFRTRAEMRRRDEKRRGNRYRESRSPESPPISSLSPSASPSPSPLDGHTQSVVRFLNSIEPPRRRRRRSPLADGEENEEEEEIPWKCESRVVWEDLGANYFPRYLRTVECLGSRCWFGHFRCSPKAFTVKVLKRRSDQCVPVRLPVGSGDDVQVKYEEEWVFEERSITFCCECVQ